MTCWLIFGLGVCIGLFTGVFLRDALDLYRASHKESSMTTSRDWGRTVATSVLVVVVALQLGVGFLLIATRLSVSDYTRCTASYNQAFSSAYQARLEASVAVDQAQDDVFRAVADKNESAFKSSLKRYVELRDEQVAKRKANPLPPLPETLCGKPTR